MVAFHHQNCFESFERNLPWLKCLVAVNIHIRNALLEVLHDPRRGGIPSGSQELYEFFQEKEQQDKIKDLQEKRVLNSDRLYLLLPQEKRTLSHKWNITLICVVIIYFSKLPPPTNGWFRPPDADDSVSASVVVARSELLIGHKHRIPDDFNDEIFRLFWSKIHNALRIFKYTKMKEFHDLETNMIDPDKFVVMNIGKIVKNVGDQIDKKQMISDLYNWLQKRYQENCKFLLN